MRARRLVRYARDPGTGQLTPRSAVALESFPNNLSIGPGGEVLVGIRPEHLTASTEANAILSGRLELVEQLGDHALAHMMRADGETFVVKMEHAPEVERGTVLHFAAREGNVHLFDKANEHRLN